MAATCEGDVYIHNLATFIRSHERQLANALVAYKKPAKGSSANGAASKPVRLSLTLHHLYYLLERFHELGMSVGPLNIRLDNIDNPDAPINYVSFLSEFHRNQSIASDAQSIHSISSVKSVMSSVSALWGVMGSYGSGKGKDSITADLKYLYSAFTKLPCLRIAPDLKAKLIEGHEEYPFDTTVPIKIFKKLSVLEISELDPKEVYGWNVLSEVVKFLVIKKANISDPVEILVELVDDDLSRRGSSVEEDEEQAISISSPQLTSQPAHHYYPPGHSHHHTLSLSTSSPSYSQHLHQPPVAPHHVQAFPSSLPDSTSSSFPRSKSMLNEETSDSRPQRSGSAGRRMRTSLYYHSSTRRLARSDSTVISSTSPPAALDPIHLSTGQATFTTEEPESAQKSNSRWKGLRHLSFAENRISHISPWSFDSLVNLSSLDLSNNLLIAVPEAIAKLGSLKSLNLSSNQLTSTKGFPKGLSKLAVLNLRYNAINSLESLDNLIGLEKLDLRHNKLKTMVELKPLLTRTKAELHLSMLNLVGNPLVNKRGYRVELFNLFNGIDPLNTIHIDGSRPGLFESRLLLDPKGAHANLVKFMDGPMISQITEGISSLKLGSRKLSESKPANESQEPQLLPPIKTDSESSNSVLQANKNIVNTPGPVIPSSVYTTAPTNELAPVLPPIKTFLNNGNNTNISISALLNPMDPVADDKPESKVSTSADENRSPTLLMSRSKPASPAFSTPNSTPNMVVGQSVGADVAS
ncbi:unnamed protein product [Kuraishia capsulata CBS 1993]|uniref:Leucine-rich repeat-containing protein n=1 Tax=Kuraishia capsulata CBS 1993 TaxID=1382522 RepID=W6MJU8_9ASCO|nr:uncharacterized protein KUCA_T00002528001 [Kuraishia capsulata CBS 1993]CDK26556.1 unnamed protein product [Kuraishia capsulata CBS 1993]